jgi:hypothetical protein
MLVYTDNGDAYCHVMLGLMFAVCRYLGYIYYNMFYFIALSQKSQIKCITFISALHLISNFGRKTKTNILQACPNQPLF